MELLSLVKSPPLFANARAEERERCVKVVREITERLSVYGVPFWAQLIEKAIRNGE
jgi:hypothetical protein